jgi:hypothetical protein
VIGVRIGETVEMERDNSSFLDGIKDSSLIRMMHKKGLSRMKEAEISLSYEEARKLGGLAAEGRRKKTI